MRDHSHHLATKKQRTDGSLEISNGVKLCLEHDHWVHAHPIEAELMELINGELYQKRWAQLPHAGATESSVP